VQEPPYALVLEQVVQPLLSFLPRERRQLQTFFQTRPTSNEKVSAAVPTIFSKSTDTPHKMLILVFLTRRENFIKKVYLKMSSALGKIGFVALRRLPALPMRLPARTGGLLPNPVLPSNFKFYIIGFFLKQSPKILHFNV
jgi:hypothetical protein